MPPPGEASRPAGPDPDRFVAILRKGRRAADADRPETAERWFRDVLAASRGTAAERLACSCLTKLFVRQGRDLEALLMARRMVALSRENGSPEDRAFAWTGVTTALADLHDWTRFDAAASQMQASVEQYAGEHAAALRRHLGRTRATAALERGDLDGARTAFAASRDLETGASSPEETMDGYILDANIEAAARRFTRARSSLTLARGIAVPMGTSALSLAHLETICQLAINGPGAALAPARRLLDLLDGADARRFGTAPRFEFARRLGVLLHCHCQAFDDARRAFDLAAEALAARAPEMERCAKDAAASSPEDSDLVTAYRDRFAAERNSLAAEVVKLFRDAALNAVAMPSLSALAKGTAGLCAYCNGARLPDGSPIAFDALGSSGARTRIVHGRCGDCTTRA